MSISKEKDCSVILCKDAEFKRRIKMLLLDAAFPAEKFNVSSAEELEAKFNSEKKIKNVVINGADFPKTEVFTIIVKIHPSLSKRPCRVLVCLDSEQYSAVGEIKEKFSQYNFVENPLTKFQVNEAFNPIKKNSGFQPPRVEKPVEKEPASKKNASFYETSKHVQDTVESLQKLMKNRSELDAVRHIGQKFNGIIGAFAFVEDKPGYKQIATMSRLIDDVARHYEHQTEGEIAENHCKLMLEAAKCSYLILKALRDGEKVEEKIIKLYTGIVADYDKVIEISRRDSQSQEDIDSMLEDAIKEHKAG